uniref:Integrin alpha-2 domain-containing protein n=1 Tax=Strigamia maritima TaxID=126957 RepID=T1JM25_STRMM
FTFFTSGLHDLTRANEDAEIRCLLCSAPRAITAMPRPVFEARPDGLHHRVFTWLSGLTILRIFCILSNVAQAFNVDLNTFITHDRPDAGMFGFAVALHRDKGNSWLLVGAPQANTRQPNVTQGGAVFRCSVETANDCQEIAFDRTGSKYVDNNGHMEKIEEKSGQWFGATIHSSGVNGVIVACAPRYVYYSANFHRREPVGTCFVARNSFTHFQEYSPCRTRKFFY